MKAMKIRIKALFMTAVIFVAATLPICAWSYTKKDFAYWGYANKNWLTETVGGVKYAYKVENGEAAILNIQTNYYESNDFVLTLPTSLGGYPVTTIGDSEEQVEVLMYLSYTDSLYPEGYNPETGIIAEHDPAFGYDSKIIIPEGYEYIEDMAFYLSNNIWSFPKSLKYIGKYNFVGVKIEGNPEDTFIYPECGAGEFDPMLYTNVVNGLYSYKKIIPPSRVKGDVQILFHNEKTYQGEIYIPANYTYEELYDTFFYNEPSLGNGGEIMPTRVSATIHCAPDCEWLSIFNTKTYYEDFTYWDQIVTDVIPATSIAFDCDTVNLKVGEYKDIEAKTYPEEALWTACDYVSSDPSVVKVDEYSGRITALKGGTATITATHCERGFTDSYTVNVEHVEPPKHEWSDEWSYDESGHWRTCKNDGCTDIDGYANHSGGKATLNAQAVCEVCGASYGNFKGCITSAYMLGKQGYFQYENREYNVIVAGSPSKLQFIRPSGATITINRSSATIEKLGNDEIWTVVTRLGEGTHKVIAKYGNVWNPNGGKLHIGFDLFPKCYKYTKTAEAGGISTITVVTDKEANKIRFVTPTGDTLTCTQSISYVGEDGLRYWTVVRKFNSPLKLELMLKYGTKWQSTAKYLTV